MKYAKHLAILGICLIVSGCTPQTQPTNNSETLIQDEDVALSQSAEYIDKSTIADVNIEDEAVALAASPYVGGSISNNSAPGTLEKRASNIVIDYSNKNDGYVMVQFTGNTDKRLKVQVAGPTTTYTYDLPKSGWTTFPLSDGNGTYKVTAFENTSGSKYATLTSQSFDISLKDEFAPFIRPNQYVDYENAPQTVKKAAELAGSLTDPLKKVEAVYDYVIGNLTYDKHKAETVQSGYLPVLDTVLATKQGICFDYASLMAGMLRSQRVPCKLVVGYAGTAYHAWISVWTKETGWIDGVIYFDGTTWQRMDPTFASSGGQSESIMKYIGDGSNYKVKYLY